MIGGCLPVDNISIETFFSENKGVTLWTKEKSMMLEKHKTNMRKGQTLAPKTG
ncbi:hypothetical protein ACFFGV_09495 [Pontibacillus salicampi]|uniref:Uncharacterized protein n=1 Tax=Pontibacillus salicampi TaxID=1449801 RepID=A0ABV6LND3_9BACI